MDERPVVDARVPADAIDEMVRHVLGRAVAGDCAR